MNRDDVIRMAKEAMFYDGEVLDAEDSFLRFAELVAKHEQERIIALLKGIDEDECDSPDGWWETSTGVEFGEGILKAIRGETK
jgi:hypothetical protein